MKSKFFTESKKYIKTYENNLNPEIEIGDYVICYESREDYYSKLNIFLENNIGQIYIIKGYLDYPYYVEYKNVPFDLKSDFSYAGVVDCRPFNKMEIKEFSKSKEDLEIKIMSKKYNL